MGLCGSKHSNDDSEEFHIPPSEAWRYAKMMVRARHQLVILPKKDNRPCIYCRIVRKQSRVHGTSAQNVNFTFVSEKTETAFDRGIIRNVMNCGCSLDALYYSEQSPSWCKYKREIVTTKGKVTTGGKKNYGKERKSTKKDDPKKISDTVFHYIKPVFDLLANKALLKQCIGLTQNPNESLHSLIWNFCPKTSFCE